eukprot:scaffold13.g180.t1
MQLPPARRSAALCALLLVAAFAPPTGAIIASNVCNIQWQVTWSVKRFGPIFMCSGRNATVTFSWPTTAQHGVFHIPSDRCPSNFTAWATNDYRELAPVSFGGSYTYRVPDEPGLHWLTSQYGSDCTDGMSAQIQVMDPSTPSTSAAAPRAPGGARAFGVAALAAAAAAALLLG